MGKPELNFEFTSSIHAFDPIHWDQIAADNGPFVLHAFLSALEDSHSVDAETGWHPSHLGVYQNVKLIGIVPLYIKSHSYGEYVFDFSWANAYHSHGLEYYPKLVNAIPFTPVTGSRIMLAPEYCNEEIIRQVIKKIIQYAESKGLSSFHSLFPTANQSAQLTQSGGAQRQAVQFQWFNQEYKDFSEYLSRFTARRRKSVKKERRKIAQQSIEIVRLAGRSLLLEHMDFFYQCYMQTYLKRSGHTGYLTESFFKRLYEEMANNLLLVMAVKQGQPVACALYLFDDNQLCGRYWGALEDIDGLHFECCYYQGIEFCIQHKLSSFNPGTQGEHKILRGFEPIYTYSNHWMLDEAFHHAIDNFVVKESYAITRYKTEAESLLPFKETN